MANAKLVCAVHRCVAVVASFLDKWCGFHGVGRAFCPTFAVGRVSLPNSELLQDRYSDAPCKVLLGHLRYLVDYCSGICKFKCVEQASRCFVITQFTRLSTWQRSHGFSRNINDGDCLTVMRITVIESQRGLRCHCFWPVIPSSEIYPVKESYATSVSAFVNQNDAERRYEL